MTLGNRFEAALKYAATVHRNQTREGNEVPYISHLLAVSSFALEYGGGEDAAIAALLHDAVEDQGGLRELDQIRLRFGDRVADIVLSCSDATPEKGQEKAPWEQRKTAYHEHLRGSTDASALLVSAADKIHNAMTTAADLRRNGPSVWSRFKATREQTLWNYRTLIDIYAASTDSRVRNLASELGRVVAELE